MPDAAKAATTPLVVGRYALFEELAAGGMATVHLGRLLGPPDVARTVAVKRLHRHLLNDREFVAMFMDEARIVARISHPHVVPMIEVVHSEEGLFLVMDYVHGESLSRLTRTARKRGEPVPLPIVAAVMCDVLEGLHAAHDTIGSDGMLLGVVHRDVSPQNVIVGADGVARVLDFGIAKAAGRAQVTREGQIKGKLAYMAPEQIRGQVDRRADVFAAAVVVWELLTSRRLHAGASDVQIVARIVRGELAKPSLYAPHVSPELDAIVERGLAPDPDARHRSALELARDLEGHLGRASPLEVSAWVDRLAHTVLESRRRLVLAMELAASELAPEEPRPPQPTLVSEPPPPSDRAIPVDLDPAHLFELDVASSSAVLEQVQMSPESTGTPAVFAHTQTSPAVVVAPPAPTRTPTARWALVALPCALALAGMSLGAYAMTHRADRRDVAERSSRPTAQPSFALTPAPAPAPALSLTRASASASASAPASAPGRPATVSAPAATTRRPGAKAPCDPPYTVERGVRRFKPECMGLD